MALARPSPKGLPGAAAIEAALCALQAGSANGGLMAYAMACKHAHLFAGVVVHGAGQDQSDLDHCHPARPLHVRPATSHTHLAHPPSPVRP